jgi:hypothetical protein
MRRLTNMEELQNSETYRNTTVEGSLRLHAHVAMAIADPVMDAIVEPAWPSTSK